MAKTEMGAPPSPYEEVTCNHCHRRIRIGDIKRCQCPSCGTTFNAGEKLIVTTTVHVCAPTDEIKVECPECKRLRAGIKLILNRALDGHYANVDHIGIDAGAFRSDMEKLLEVNK